MKDGMLDLETLGQKSGCIIRSIGCVAFDPRGEGSAKPFYVNVDEKSCIDLGLVEDPQTRAWWNKQPQQAKDSLIQDQRPIKEALAMFVAYWKGSGCQRVWAQGSNFDVPIIEEALVRCGMKTPWFFWNARDTRTAYDMANFNPKSVSREGIYHNALDDAKFQVTLVQKAYKLVKTA